ncbi:MAG TPA: acyl carrier protein [Gammaproteobacteria bacterium]|nr:acyl carrier protein [Gammaproteobacteria bacterium]
MTTTFDGLRAIIVRDFDLPPERLQRDTLLEEIELDSLSITELVFSIEDEFKITAENTIPPFKTLGDIADYVARLIAERDTKPRVTVKAGALRTAPKAAASPSMPKPAAQRAKKARSARNREAEPEKRPSGAREARAKTGKHANGATRANGANAGGKKRAGARAAEALTPEHSSTPPKRKRSSGGRAGARAR